MRFHLTSEQEAIQESIRGTLQTVFPRKKLDAIMDGDADFDRESWDALMALGLGGLMLPEEVGGTGLGLLEAAISSEVLGEQAFGGPFIGHVLTGVALMSSDNIAARQQWLEGLASGEVVATMAWGGHWRPDTWKVQEKQGRISGEVQFVQAASAAKLFLVGLQGGGLALAEAGDSVTITPIKSTDRSRRLSSLVFDNTPAHILYQPGDLQVQRIFDAGLVLVAADALGGAQYCVDLSVAYAKEREQFGQPIGRFQALKHQLATMALEVEPARALLWYAAYAYDANLPDASRAASLAKSHICDRYVSITRAAVAAHGGIGYTWEYGLNIWMRRSVFDRAFLGSPAAHRARAANLAGW